MRHDRLHEWARALWACGGYADGWDVSDTGALTCPHGGVTAPWAEGCPLHGDDDAEPCPHFPDGFMDALTEARAERRREVRIRAKRRADYYRHGHPRWGAFKGPWPGLNDDEARALALSRMGYAAGGIGEVLDVSANTAKKYIRRAADEVGVAALETAHPDLLKRWPHAPVPWHGPADEVTRRWHRTATDRTREDWHVVGGEVVRCPHGNEVTPGATMGKRAAAVRTSGVRVGTAAKRGCTCVHPIIQTGKW